MTNQPKEKKPKTEGVLLLAYGKRGYGFCAINMAVSIKFFNPEVKIHLVCEAQTMSQVPQHVIDRFIDEVTYRKLEEKEPALKKWEMLTLSKFDRTLYLDVDGMALRDVAPLFNKFKGKAFQAQYMGHGGYGEHGISYDAWADLGHEYTYRHFNIPQDKAWYTCQTSFMYFEKGKTFIDLQSSVVKNFYTNFDISKMRYRWGGFIPDELMLSANVSKQKDPMKFLNPKEDVIFFPSVFAAPSEVVEKYYVLSLYGGEGGRSLVRPIWYEYYDRTLIKMYEKFGLEHYYKHNIVMKDKLLSGN